MPFYAVSASNVAMTAGNDLVTLISASNKRFKLHEVSISGMGTVSAANEVQIARSTVGTTPGGAQTPTPLIADSPAAATVADTTWSVQPTLGTVIARLGVNANGGIYRWVAKPGEEPEWRNADQLSIRCAVGSSNVSWHAIFEEI